MAELPPVIQESTRIRRGWSLAVMFSVLVFGALLCFVANLALSAGERTRTHATSVLAPVTPEPEVSRVRMQLLKEPGAGQQLKAQQRRALDTYGWVDRAHGIVRIPIDVGMELEAKEQHR